MPSRSRPVARRPDAPPPAGDRLQKVLAAAGLGSRRECEELILAGRVEVDRQTVTELGTRVDPQEQAIRVDGQPIKLTRRLYYAVHKPPGLLSTNRDPSGRPRGALLSHSALHFQSRVKRERRRLCPRDSVLPAAPLFLSAPCHFLLRPPSL